MDTQNNNNARIQRLVKQAKSSDTPTELVERLAQHSLYYIREAAASNLKLSPQTLSNMLYDPSPLVRRTVERNPNTPQQAIVEARLYRLIDNTKDIRPYKL